MQLILYPFTTIEINRLNALAQIDALWQREADKLPKVAHYGVYHHYAEHACQYSIATELALGSNITPIEVDLSWYERFPSNIEQRRETWQDILRKSQQGLLKRAFTVDIEKYSPDGKVEIYIAVSPHC